MVRAPAFALTRATGFALLNPAEKPKLDPSRIFTLSGTLTFNLILFGLLMVPMSIPLTPMQDPPSHNPVVRSIVKPPEPVIVEIAPITRPQPPQPINPPAHPSVTRSPDTTPATQVISDTGNTQITTPAVDDGGAHGDSLIPSNVTPAPMQLAYRNAPPPVYPRAALQRQLTGTVLLQVLVDINGQPIEVSISRSSGHRELDEAARLQVLKRWSFQPAIQNGKAVQALGLVPIEFNLRH
ncbi:MAG TPA: TonB family protein [Thermomonas sp.]|jgi:protein TonB|nr:TonB family protein [Thermomonas sp.]